MEIRKFLEIIDTVNSANNVVNAITCVCDTINGMDRDALRKVDITDLLMPVQILGDYAMNLLDKALEVANEELEKRGSDE